MSKKDENLLKTAREQFALAEAGDSEARNEAQEDLSIYEGSGIWDEQLKNSRINDPKGGRPCLTISDLPPRVRQITNDVRQNKPAIKIRPVDSGADVQTAEVLNGIFRHIEQQSMSDIAYETANLYQAIMGFGYFRLVDGISPEEQQHELFIRPIPNPFAVFMDPASLCPVGSDARFCFIVEDIGRDEFDREYGSKDEVVGWNEDTGLGELTDTGWFSEDTVRIAEWMSIEELSNNRIITETGEFGEEEYWEQPDRAKIIETRTDRRVACMWRKIIGNRVLKEIELPITYLPVFRVPGEMYVKSGKTIYKGVVRDSRDAVRMVSYTFSSYIESISVQTKTPYIGAAGQFAGFEEQWAAANIENAAALEYNPISLDGTTALPAPRREPPPMASQGIIQGLVLSQQALKDVTGMGAASLGQKGNETSGKAILARQKEGDVSTYHYSDNLAKAIRHLGRVGLQWIPKVYSERRVARILGDDGTAKMVHLDPNQQQSVREVQYADEKGYQKIRKIYNLGVGCYDVVTTVGPSFSTRRQEASEMLGNLFQSAPALIQLLGDIYLGDQDIPGADRMAKRLKAMLPPQAAAADNEGEDELDIPPQVVAQMEQMQQQLQEGAQIVEGLQAEKERLEGELASKQGEIEAKMHATNAGIEEEKIKSLANVTIAEMNNESREKIAGLQAQVNEMQETMKMFLAAINGAGAAQPETPEE